jgi:Ca2+-binding RTX toxin-like protein
MPETRFHTFSLLMILAVVVALGAPAIAPRTQQAAALSCPPGTVAAPPTEAFGDLDGASSFAQQSEAVCVVATRTEHPERFSEVQGLANEWAAKMYAPWTSVDGRAYPSAIRERQRMDASGAVADATWQPYGQGPLITDDPRFPNVNGNGFTNLSGRIDSLDYDPATGRLFGSVGTGGVWMSEDLGENWRSIGDSLPTQIIGAIAWTNGGGGRVLAVGGEPLNGGNTYTGIGAFWTDDLGATWHQATGVPTGILGYQVAVDPTNPEVAYVATSKGLFRTTDAGTTYQNVNLPTGPCAGNTGDQECLFANWVTDVVVQSPDTFGNTGGTVLAALGYRVGNRAFPQNPAVIEGPSNGLYRSDTGAPGSFTKLAASGFTPQFRIGRTELGTTDGPLQNHDYVYAIVQDAELMRGGTQGIDAPDTFNPTGANSVINGIYVSANFGDSWTQMANTDQIAYNPSTGSALAGFAAINPPGIQAWYNEWIKVDPTRQVAGTPTRILFGLEEIWENRLTNLPATGPTDFHVIGRYFSNDACILGVGGALTCPPGGNPLAPTTTHPDQQDALFVPDATGGGVTLFAGNDGGVFTQHVASGTDFSNMGWGDGGKNNGFHTLLPYFAAMAKDGTVWFGLQDNGSGKIEPDTGKQFMTFGGDGFWVATDPDNSDVAYSEVTGGNMRVTTDGGTSWRDMYPFTSGAKFANPFTMDPTDANHLMTAGNEVVESTFGPTTQQMDPSGSVCNADCWEQVYDLGTRNAPGDEAASATAADPANGMSALDLQGNNAYVAYCGPCGLISQTVAFRSGIATNVAGTEAPEPMTPKGWHIASANGLPERYVNGIAVDPSDPSGRTVYAALGGYENRQWRPPGSFADPNDQIGTGHVFVSHDAGETFTNISANLPDAPAFWVEPYGDRVIVATQVGVFISDSLTARGGSAAWSSLNQGLPATPVASLQFAPQDPDLLVAASFGRGVYTIDLSGLGSGGGGLSGCGRLAKLTNINKLFGTKGKDVLRGTPAADAICGGPGNDTIKGLNGNDILIGGKGNDRVSGGGGNDKLYLGAGNDRSNGGKRRDRIVGYKGNDSLSGGGGNDSLNGQSGTDRCKGGSGKNTFRHCES